MREHLLTPTYKQLTLIAAKNKLNNTRQLLVDTCNQYKNTLSQAEQTFFIRSFKNQHRTPIFYGMPKVHKTPIKLHPVVSCINSFNSIFSTWLDYRMQQLLRLIPPYIRDSTSLLEQPGQLNLPENAKIFTADATAMYTNIDNMIGIQAITELVESNRAMILNDFPTIFFLTMLDIIMSNNISTFRDTYWQQLQGTAMGTPEAPLYSILTFGLHEKKHILNQFNNNLIFYKRYIDDIIGIWLETLDDSWTTFKTTLDQFGSLRWNVEKPTTTTTFLDLEISITHNRIHTKTYPKPLYLYLYIPPHSAHPTSCFKGFITGELL